MRRKDREITDLATMESIIHDSIICRVAMCKDNQPYVVPFNFGYEDSTVYVHGAREGQKFEYLEANNCVCVEFEAGVSLLKDEVACKWSMAYRSVIGYGSAYLVDDIGSKRKACDLIMSHYSGQPHQYTDEQLDSIIVIRIELDRMTGKRNG